MMRLPFVAAVLLALVLPAGAEGPGILTVSGLVSKTDYGPVATEDVGLFSHFDIAFDNGHMLDRDTLAALPQTHYVGAPETGAMTFSGPLLADVLTHVGATGDQLQLTALDGYAVAFDTAHVEEHRPIVAIAADGRPLDIGRLGPATIVFPPTADAALAQELNSQAIWALFHIAVSDE